MGTCDPRQVELLSKIREGVDNAISAVGEIEGRLLACSKLLRIDQRGETFTALALEISNLGDLVELVREIKKGSDLLASRPLEAGAFDSWEKSIGLFRDMLTAFEGKDWIVLADLIQYELSPILAQGEKDLAAVRDRLASQ